MKLFFSLVFFILAPLSALAAETGFPSQTIWVSNSSPAEGETVVVSAVIYNGDTSDLRGTLVFLADEARIGAREFELPGETSQVHSVEWKPAEGAYELTARIEGTSAPLSQSETPPLRITIRPPPAPSAAEQTISQTVEIVSTLASTTAPFVSDTAQTILSHTEKLRHAGVEALEKFVASPPATAQGFVAGTSTSRSGSGGFDATKGKELLSNLTHAAAAATLFVMKNVALFYPIAGILILGTLFWLARRVRRPY